MSTKDQSLSAPESLPSGKGAVFGIVVARWNTEITETLFEGARQTLLDNEVDPKHILRLDVPGSFELPFGAATLIRRQDMDAVICLGCIIKGETPHNEFIAHAVANGLTKLSIDNNVPVIFGVLTPNTMDQAKDRAGGRYGNKGVEAAATALQMIRL
ncbi:MAG: 6,7-dimethyl-8-ribityllumazine synthase [Flavobacteriales bacterium]|nr:6,7-dimethyl-8-ribityllumazine synthase [Flavobacteriales bacterium]